MIFIPKLEEMLTENIQALGEKWLQRLPKGREKTLGKVYLYKPTVNKSRLLYGNSARGREGIIQVFLEIIANVLIYEHGEAQRTEDGKAWREKRKAMMIPFIENHSIGAEEIETYTPYKSA